MKHLALLSIVFYAAAVCACPNLTGTFTCPPNSGVPSFTINITQISSGGITTYTFDYNGSSSNSLIADGITRTTNYPSLKATVSITSTCNDSELTEKIDWSGASNPGNPSETFHHSKDSSGSYIEVGDGINGNGKYQQVCPSSQ
jgi:hypothetical protein